MIRVFIFLATLLMINHASPSSFIAIQAPKGGEIPLKPFYFGYIFNADYIKQDPESLTVQTRGIMHPSLFSSESLLVHGEDCVSFNEYDCSQYDCTEYPEQEAEATYPYLTAKGNYAKLPLILDYANWEINTPAVIATTCEGFFMYGSNMNGIVGLGHAGKSGENFIGSKVFSVYLPQNGTDGKMFFHFDPSYALSEKPITTLKTDDNWHVSSIQFINVGNTILEVGDHSLIFDLSGLDLGLPKKTFDGVFLALKEGYEIECDKTLFNPNCTFTGLAKDFPSLTINTESGEKFLIPPQVFIEGGEEKDRVFGPNITLKFRATSSQFEKNLSYVTPQYDNTIIVGANIMKSFYLKFDVAENVISVFDANHGSPSEPESNFWTYVIILLILIGSCIAVYFIYTGAKKKKQEEPNPYASVQG